MKIKIAKKITDYWSSYLHKYNAGSDANYNTDSKNLIIGKLWWTAPKEVFWLYATNNEEGYEGSQTQIGVKKDGTVVWGYFSHCSCFGYEDYEGDHKVYEETEHQSQKIYEMKNVDLGVLSIIKQRLIEIGKLGLNEEK